MLRAVVSLSSCLLILPVSTVEASHQLRLSVGVRDVHPTPPAHAAEATGLLSAGRALQDSVRFTDYTDGTFHDDSIGGGMWRDGQGDEGGIDFGFYDTYDAATGDYSFNGCVFDCGEAEPGNKLAGGVIAAIVIASFLCCCVPCIVGGVMLCCFAGARQRQRRGAAPAAPVKAGGAYAYGHPGPPQSAAVAPEAPIGIDADTAHSGKLTAAHIGKLTAAAPEPTTAPPPVPPEPSPTPVV